MLRHCQTNKHKEKLCRLAKRRSFSILGIINLGKRLHDIDLNAWYGAIFNIVILGWSILAPESNILLLLNSIVGLGVLLIPGTEGENRYGKNPLEKN